MNNIRDMLEQLLIAVADLEDGYDKGYNDGYADAFDERWGTLGKRARDHIKRRYNDNAGHEDGQDTVANALGNVASDTEEEIFYQGWDYGYNAGKKEALRAAYGDGNYGLTADDLKARGYDGGTGGNAAALEREMKTSKVIDNYHYYDPFRGAY